MDYILKFEKELYKKGLSKETINSYIWTLNYYKKHYKELNTHNLLEYKSFLLENYKAKTVNLRIQAINKYLKFRNLESLSLKSIKIQQKSFIDNVISNADYVYFKNCLKNDKNKKWYFVVWYLAATGARVSELIQLKIEHVNLGYFDIYSKGGKLRRLFIPKILRDETILWLNEENRHTGYLFLNRFNNSLTPRGISEQLKFYASKYGIKREVVYPHSFRHLFAKNFLDHYNDLAMLADLMGHDSIETTRIYLRRTATEQQEVVDRVVTW